MGNCQAAEVAAVVIQHPVADKTERIHCSVSASHVMASNPGHYVAHVVASPALRSGGSGVSHPPLMQLKLLRPDDALLLGNVYRLVSFEDVLKFGVTKCVKLRRRGLAVEPNMNDLACLDSNQNKKSRSGICNFIEVEEEVQGGASNGIDGGIASVTQMRRHQWRPTLQSIAEVGAMTHYTTTWKSISLHRVGGNY